MIPKTLLPFRSLLASQVDVWAIGVLSFELLTGYAPFEKDSRLEMYENIMHKEPEFPLNLSHEAIRFMKSTLDKVCLL